MPEEITDSFTLLSDEVKINILQNLSAVWASPVQVLHLVNLAMRSLTLENETAIKIINSLLVRLYESDIDSNNFKSFHISEFRVRVSEKWLLLLPLKIEIMSFDSAPTARYTL